MSSGPFVPVKKTNTRKSLCQFSSSLDVKPKTAVCRLCPNKSKRKSVRADIMMWSSITERRDHAQINEFVRRALYSWLLQHPKVVQSPIANDYLKLSIYGKAEPQLVPKLLLQVSVREIHNIMVSLL